MSVGISKKLTLLYSLQTRCVADGFYLYFCYNKSKCCQSVKCIFYRVFSETKSIRLRILLLTFHIDITWWRGFNTDVDFYVFLFVFDCVLIFVEAWVPKAELDFQRIFFQLHIFIFLVCNFIWSQNCSIISYMFTFIFCCI